MFLNSLLFYVYNFFSFCELTLRQSFFSFIFLNFFEQLQMPEKLQL